MYEIRQGYIVVDCMRYEQVGFLEHGIFEPIPVVLPEFEGCGRHGSELIEAEPTLSKTLSESLTTLITQHSYNLFLDGIAVA